MSDETPDGGQSAIPDHDQNTFLAFMSANEHSLVRATLKMCDGGRDVTVMCAVVRHGDGGTVVAPVAVMIDDDLFADLIVPHGVIPGGPEMIDHDPIVT